MSAEEMISVDKAMIAIMICSCIGALILFGICWALFNAAGFCR